MRLNGCVSKKASSFCRRFEYKLFDLSCREGGGWVKKTNVNVQPPMLQNILHHSAKITANDISDIFFVAFYSFLSSSRYMTFLLCSIHHEMAKNREENYYSLSLCVFCYVNMKREERGRKKWNKQLYKKYFLYKS
mgnify:CR=1 FL=1